MRIPISHGNGNEHYVIREPEWERGLLHGNGIQKPIKSIPADHCAVVAWPSLKRWSELLCKFQTIKLCA